MTARQKLLRNLAESGPLCIGLDPDPARIPQSLRGDVARFLIEIIHATADLASAYKINTAFFESLGREGFMTLARVRDVIPERALVIWDAKRGDIENTNRHYAHSAFVVWQADAVTVHPYLGLDALAPFFAFRDRLTFVLCATSEGCALQDLQAGVEPLFAWVARQVQERDQGQCGLVVGATQAGKLDRVRALAPQLPLLVPGVGAQGGQIPAQPALINASRAILYAAHEGRDFAAAAREAAVSLIASCRSAPLASHCRPERQESA